MKRKTITVAGMLLAGVLALSGCTAGEGVQLSYDDQIHPELGDAYVEELFYRNDLFTAVPDPCVIQITDKESTEYGYYYLYGTSDPDTGYRAFRNKDLTGKWEDVTPTTQFLAFQPKPNSFAHGCFWAPEVIYDEEEGMYYMFYSGLLSGGAIVGQRMIGVAKADEPYGPFEPVGSAADTLFDNDTIVQWCRDNGEQTGDTFNCIDPHPYVAPDGTKYLYFCHEHDGMGNDSSDVLGVVMTDWATPDYSTLTVLARAGYFEADKDKGVPDYEQGNKTDEGPYMFQKQGEDGKWHYYLTLSINGYTDKSYSVVQSVGDSPLGPFRKLTQEEGGILLGTDNQQFDHASGTGHHSFVVVGDEIFMVYHEHYNRESGGTGERDVAVDRVVWTKNSNGLDVLYCNGPTWSLQPRAEKHSEYKNIAREATVSVTKGSNKEALNDGMLAIYSNIDYVKEFEAEETTTITLDFGEYREITALMVYNSKVFEHSFVDVKRVEFDFEYEGQTGMAYIDDLAFNWDFYMMQTAAKMRPGGSAVAVFNPLKVKTIRITVEVPETRPDKIAIQDDEGFYVKQTKVAVSEIAVLGK